MTLYELQTLINHTEVLDICNENYEQLFLGTKRDFIYSPLWEILINMDVLEIQSTKESLLIIIMEEYQNDD